ncbi:MAG TPA: sucrose phosphorylase [Galbitalea sp.]|jgi:sucrose phosphorylase|nr:sucrose phosphorylase [Galbitalea sp.]
MTRAQGTGVELLAYADRLGGDLSSLERLLDGPLRVFQGVHILPFYVPFDGADAGFDPVDHSSVDPRLGDWDTIRSIASRRDVTADLIVNHVSSHSREFADWLARGTESPNDGMFLTFDTVFPYGASEADITRFYRPRPGLPFTPYRSEDGRRHLVWTTFLPDQVDLDVDANAAKEYFRRILRTLADAGVTTVRLDAVGYAIKTAGTDSFMTAETLAFVPRITAMAHAVGLQVLVEVHAHYSQQLAIAPLVDFVYDFALAPILLHSLGTGTVDRLGRWLAIRPTNAITVLDTHDGIGIIDAGPAGNRPGILDFEDMAAIFARADVATSGHSRIASTLPEWTKLPHQINATFFSALGANVDDYLLARAIQLWVPGRPQLYYVGLLGGLDDVDLFRKTASGRDVNRHRYSSEELDAALTSDTARALLELARIRSEHPAFAGIFSSETHGESSMEFTWTAAGASARLSVDVSVARRRFAIRLASDSGNRKIDGLAALLYPASEGSV